MGFFGRMRGWFTPRDPYPVGQVFTLVPTPGEVVPGVRVPPETPAQRVLTLLGLESPTRGTLFITGGASEMSATDIAHTRRIFEDGVAPVAQQYNLAVFDGGTNAGIIEMMATARRKVHGTFPLVGVAPFGQVSFAGHTNPRGYPLAAGHSHFVFVDADTFGHESRLLIGLAHAIAGGTPDRPLRREVAVGLVVNGGDITRREAYMAGTQSLQMPLLVMEDSGRAASEIADAMKTGRTDSALIRAIVAHGRTTLISAGAGVDAVRAALDSLFAARRPS